MPQPDVNAGSLGVAARAIGLSFLAHWQCGIAVVQRTEATARRLSAEAQLALADRLADPQVSVHNLLVSLALAPSTAAIKVLATGVVQPKGLARSRPGTEGSNPSPSSGESPANLLVGSGEISPAGLRAVLARPPGNDLDTSSDRDFRSAVR